MPKYALKSVLVFGLLKFLSAYTLASVIDTLPLPTVWPRYNSKSTPCSTPGNVAFSMVTGSSASPSTRSPPARTSQPEILEGQAGSQPLSASSCWVKQKGLERRCRQMLGKKVRRLVCNLTLSLVRPSYGGLKKSPNEKIHKKSTV